MLRDTQNTSPNPQVPAESFLTLLCANVENDRLSDEAFRDFVRNSLPVVQFPRPCETS